MELVQRGQYCVLPIIGWSVSQVCLQTHSLPSVGFSAPNHKDARLELEAVVLTYHWMGQEQTLLWDKGKPYHTSSLAPFVEMLGHSVKEALAHSSGSLTLELSGDILLTACPEVWEGWHFSNGDIIIHGNDGRLIL